MTLIKVKSRGTDNVSGRRNILINGAMQVAQRGTSSTTNGYAALDRWTNSHGGGTVTQTQQALTSGSPYNDGHRNFLRATNTAAGSTAASDSLQIYQVIEAQNLATCGWDSTSSSSFITMSAWVRSSLAGTYSVRLYTYDSNKNYTFQITLSANTWTKITHSIPGASGVTVNNDNGAGMFVSFSVYQGTNNTDSGFTANQWATFASGSQAPNYAQNWRATGSATFDVTGIQMEVGDSASDFKHRSFGEELALCQRYYQAIGAGGGYYAGNAVGTNKIATGLPLATSMRATPSTPPNVSVHRSGNQTVTASIDQISLGYSADIGQHLLVRFVGFSVTDEVAYNVYLTGVLKLDSEL